MALISGRQMGPDMPTLAKQFKTSKSVIWATLNTPNRSKATGRSLKTSSGDDRIIVRMSKKNPRLTNTDINSELKDQYGVQDSVQGHCQKTSAQRWTLQKGPSEQANDSGEEPFSSTEVGKGSSALEWNKVLWSDESKYLMIGTEGIIHVRRPVKSFMLSEDVLRHQTRTKRLSLQANVWENRKKEVRATQGRMDQDPTSNPDELDRVHAKRCEAVIKAKGMATKY
uniref:Uncharacterized protein n=1 Tax=Caenorhabditis japonica TaxID=281687 RepID=A0A8R1EKS2_CAEJA